MSLSKKEFYSDFLYKFNGNLVKWVLIPNTENLVQESSDQKESKEEKKKSKTFTKLDLEVLFTYNKKTGSIKLSGVQITSVLGYPSSSIVFNSKDIKDINKTNSTYKFTVKSSPYDWEMTLSSEGVKNKQEEEEEENGTTRNTKTNKPLQSK